MEGEASSTGGGGEVHAPGKKASGTSSAEPEQVPDPSFVPDTSFALEIAIVLEAT